MSDQSFGKASRDAWDDAERLAEHRRQFERNEVRERLNIKTENIFPPIPIRDYDWTAVDDDTYDGLHGSIGFGRTEQEAIDDLIDKIMERSNG